MYKTDYFDNPNIELDNIELDDAVDREYMNIICKNLKENKDNEIDFTFHSGATRKLLNELEQKKYDLVFCSKPPAEYRFTSVAVEFVLDKYKKHEN